MGRLRGYRRHLTVLVGLSLGLAACGGASTPAPTTTRPTPPASTQAAQVAYAGSLQALNERSMGPAFHAATGLAYQGRGGGSFGLSREIQAGEISPNVFESMGSAPITSLGAKARWYVEVASSPLVIAYSPTSRFAPDLTAVAQGRRPLSYLFNMFTEPGFRLGRTNPLTDPQGRAFAQMVYLAQSQFSLPPGSAAQVLGNLVNSPEIFSETSLDAHLQAGQLDAASAFLSQAKQLGLPYIALPASLNFSDSAMAQTYASSSITLGGKSYPGHPLTVDETTLGAPNSAAARFVAFTLSPSGRALWKRAGFTPLAPVVHGDMAAVPAPVRAELATLSAH